MPRRGENIYKRRDGRWEARVLKTDGRYRYVYAKSYKEVREKKKRLQDSPCSAGGAAQKAKNAAALFERWLRERTDGQIRPTTYESYYRCMSNYVIPFFRESGDKKITENCVRRFVRHIHENDVLSDAYKRKIVSIFKTALRDILKDAPDCAPILKSVSLPKPESEPVEVFSIREQRLIENAVLKSGDKRAFGILLCFYSGIRLGELCALRWGDIDFEAGSMSVVRTVCRIKNFGQGGGKTTLYVGVPKSRKSVRRIPLPDFLLKLARRFRTGREGGYLLTSSDVPIEPRTYQKLYKKILASAGVKDRKFHAIRHTFATRALELGIDVKTLSEILGHANATITLNIYAHSLFEQKKIAIDKLNELHETCMGPAAFAVPDPVASL